MLEERNHIDKAISELPIHKAPDYVWGRIEAELNKEQGRVHLEKAVEQYTSIRKTPEQVWYNLEKELDILKDEEPLRKAIDALPLHIAPDHFEKVVLAEKKKLFQLSQKTTWLSGIAASFLVLVGLYFFNLSGEDVMLTSHTEEASESNLVVKAAIDQLDKEDEILQIIEMHCAQIVLRCGSPEFKGLFDYYLELDASKDELLAVMSENQEQIQLVDYLVRVEKEKNEVGKQLIQMIIG